jgi:hypothetical protein
VTLGDITDHIGEWATDQGASFSDQGGGTVIVTTPEGNEFTITVEQTATAE